MATTVNYRFVVKRDTAANFTAANTLLLQGEFGLETDTLKTKIGDGATHWNSLGYFMASPAVMSAVLDAAFGSSQGSILYRDSAQWKVLAPATAGNVLQTNGPGSNPSWGTGGGGSSGSAQVPARISGLVYWFDASVQALPASAAIIQLPPPDPYRQLNSATADAGATSAVVINATQLNSLNVAQCVGSPNCNFTTALGYTLTQGTIFFVANPTSGDLIGGKATTGAANIQYDSTNHRWGFAKASVAVIGTGSNGSAPLSTWKQANCAWSTAAWAWRESSAADTSGSAAITISGASNALFYQGNTVSTNNFTGLIAEMIVYFRQLTLTEIQAVEAYLLAKWGV